MSTAICLDYIPVNDVKLLGPSSLEELVSVAKGSEPAKYFQADKETVKRATTYGIILPEGNRIGESNLVINEVIMTR